MLSDRRCVFRKPLQAGEYIIFSPQEGVFYLCPLLDISNWGMMLYAPGFCEDDVRSAGSVLVDECSEKLRALLKNKRGDVVWSGGDVCGIRFRQQLDVSNTELHHLIAHEAY